MSLDKDKRRSIARKRARVKAGKSVTSFDALHSRKHADHPDIDRLLSSIGLASFTCTGSAELVAIAAQVAQNIADEVEPDDEG